MGRDVKRNLSEYGPSVDIGSVGFWTVCVCFPGWRGGCASQGRSGCSGWFLARADRVHFRLDRAKVAAKRKSVRLGGDGAGDGSDDEPLHGAAESLAKGTSAGEVQCGVPFPAEGLGFGLFVGEVGGGGGQAGLAGLAIHGEVVE